MTIGRNVNKPRIARFGPTNIHAMRGTPSRRWSARIGGSIAFSVAAAIVAGSANSGLRAELTIERAERPASYYLFGRGLHLFVDVSADAFQCVIERHLAGHGLAKAGGRRI